MARAFGLVGDVGGTHARFAIAETDGKRTRIRQAAVLNAADYPTGEAALEAYLKRLKGRRPQAAVIAAAGPIQKGKVAFTNNDGWGFSERRMAKKCGFAEVRLINDFTAQALAIDRLGPRDTRRIGPDVKGRRQATAAIMGPGTGFGAAALVRDGRTQAVLTGEGGHAAFAPEDETEIEILRRLTARFGEVSVERVVSGPGLYNLYQTLAGMTGRPASLAAPDQVTHAGLAGPGLARDALSRFCAILGSVAGNLALAMGAQGGVYISGGIAPDIFDFLKASDFRRRFESKDRMSDYLRAIPTRVVMQPHAALIGAAALLGDLK
ncbi:MAG TPA: glucokinase [Caulobacteraceae bacterium]